MSEIERNRGGGDGEICIHQMKQIYICKRKKEGERDRDREWGKGKEREEKDR